MSLLTKQGNFLALDAVDSSKFAPAFSPMLCTRLAMFAEGVGNVSAAGTWVDESLRLAEEIPEKTSTRYAFLGVAPAVLAGDYGKAIQLALRMAAPDSSTMPEMGFTDPVAQQKIQETVPHPNLPAALMIGCVPVALNLGTLKLQGRPQEQINAGIDLTTAALSGNDSQQNIQAALRRSLVEGMNWRDLHSLAQQFVPRLEAAAAGLIYMIGAILGAPLSQSLFSQVWLARQAEQIFTFPSIHREIVYPFFKAFWMQALSNTFQFNTSEAYTRRSIEADGPSRKAVKQLLDSMSFCLGVALPREDHDWLKT